MKVYEMLARAFAAEGVTDVFGVMGDANMYWLDAIDKLGVRQYEVRHEGAGLAMADGWARIAGTPGVTTTTSGPGVAQLATTMIVASRARTPLVAFVGEAPMGDDEYVQRLDQERFAAATEAAFVGLRNPQDAAEVARKAFYLAKLESRPVMLSAPMDMQNQKIDDDEYVTSSQLLPSQIVLPDPVRIAQAVEIIAGSRHPVLIVGRGAMRAGVGDLAVRLASRIGALIATTLMSKNWLNTEPFHAGISGQYSTRTAMELFQEADCVIAVGASLNKYTVASGYLYPNARFIHLDRAPHVVMGAGRTADCYVQTDARSGLEALDRELGAAAVCGTGYRTPEVASRLSTSFEDREAFPIEDGTVDPRAVCLALDEAIPGNVGLVLGGGQVVCFSTMLFNRPRSLLLANQHFGCIGQGLTTAMGAVVASGMKPAFLMEGDVGFMMHLPEFETAVRYAMPLLVVVMNDMALGAEYHKMRAKGLKSDLARVTTPDLGQVAVALGGRGRLARSVEEVRAAAAEFVARPGPMLIDVRISRNVLSVPYRRLHFGQDA